MTPDPSGSDVLIRIVTAYEKGGIEEAKKAADELSATFGQTSPQTQTAAAAMAVLERNGAKGAAALRNFASAARGGPGALNALGSGITQLAGMLGVGGPFIMAIQLAVSGVQLYMDVLGKQKKSAEEAAAAAQKHAADLQAAADQIKTIHDTSIAERAEEFRQMGQAAREAADQASAVANATLALENAKLDNQIAGLEAQKAGATPEQAAEIDAQISALKNQKSLNSNQAQQDAIEREKQGLLAERDDATQAVLDEQRFNATYRGGAAWKALSLQDQKAISQQVQQEVGELLADESFGQGLGDADREEAAHEAVKQKHLAREEAAKARLDDVNARIDNWSATSGLRQQTLQIQQDTLLTQGQTQQDAHARNIDQIRQDQADRDAAAAAAAAATPRALAGQVSAMVGRGQRDAQGQLYDVDVDGGAVRRNAMATLKTAVDAAAASKGGDEAEAAIIGQAVDAIESMGANLRADKAAIAAKLQELVNAIQKVESQVKNARS